MYVCMYVCMCVCVWIDTLFLPILSLIRSSLYKSFDIWMEYSRKRDMFLSYFPSKSKMTNNYQQMIKITVT